MTRKSKKRKRARRKERIALMHWYRGYRDEVEDVFAVFDRVTAELDAKGDGWMPG